MAARTKRQAGRRPAQRSTGWGMLVIGMLTGIVLAVGGYWLYLKPKTVPVQPIAETPRHPTPEIKPRPAQGQPAAAPERFDFYRLLPEMEVDTPAPPTASKTPGPPAAERPDTRLFFLQAGSFRTHQQADRRRAELALLGVESTVLASSEEMTRWHRVRIGPLRGDSELARIRRLLDAHRIASVVMKPKG